MSMKRILSASVALAVAGLSNQLIADSIRLDDQVVTATRTSQSEFQGIAAASVITRADIERTQATDVAQVLRRIPGLSLTNTGGPGKNTNVSIRGSNSNHVLVLIDGVRTGSATTGDVAFQNLPIEQIERIEVVRGPRSSLYGSEAIGGVIQITTRRGPQDGIKPYASVTAGSRNHHAATAGVSGAQGNAWYNLGVTGLETRGIDARPGAPVASREPDSDGYREYSGNLAAGYRFANGLELDGHLLEVKSSNEFDPSSSTERAPYADNRLRAHGVRARFAPMDPWTVTLQAGRSEDKTDTFRRLNNQPTSFNTRIDTRRDSFSLQNDVAIGDANLVTLGYDYLHDSVNGTTAFVEDSRDNHGLYLQWLGQAGRHHWQAAVRDDDNQAHGRYTTGSLGYGFALTERLQATASYGTAFKAPTFNQLYHPVNGNPAIREETSRNIEAGLEGTQQWGEWSVAVFRNEIDNLIAFFNQGDGLRAYNIDKAVIRGVETAAFTQVMGWDVATNLTLQDPANRSSRANQGNLLPRRPEQIFNLDVDKPFGNVSVGAGLHVEGRRWDNTANTQEMSGYNTVELRTEYRFTPAWRLQARVTNLFDTDYETTRTYQQQGRAGYLTLRYQAL